MRSVVYNIPACKCFQKNLMDGLLLHLRADAVNQTLVDVLILQEARHSDDNPLGHHITQVDACQWLHPWRIQRS